jgi:hypothetical protein
MINIQETIDKIHKSLDNITFRAIFKRVADSQYHAENLDSDDISKILFNHLSNSPNPILYILMDRSTSAPSSEDFSINLGRVGSESDMFMIRNFLMENASLSTEVDTLNTLRSDLIVEFQAF